MPLNVRYQLGDLGDLFFEDSEGFTEVKLLVVCLRGVEAAGEGDSCGQFGSSHALRNKTLEVLDHGYLSLDSK